MNWVYDNLGGGHNGEYYHTCSSCGYKDWFAYYTNPNKEKIKCPKCKDTPK